MAKTLGATKLTDNVLVTSASLTTEVTGVLPVANGGTGTGTYNNGELLIGNTTGNTLTKATLTAGTGITITNGAGSISIATSGSGGGPGYTYIVKSASQDVTNAGLTIDNDFTFAVLANNRYMLTMDLVIAANSSTGDYAMDFSLSAGTQKGRGSIQTVQTSGGAVLNALITAAGTANTTAVVSGMPADLDTLIHARVQYAFLCTSDATMRFRFGNNSIAAGRTSRTYKGSVLAYKNIT